MYLLPIWSRVQSPFGSSIQKGLLMSVFGLIVYRILLGHWGTSA
jgi:hypothetical protein